jgi:hypothetical protein
MNTQIHNSDDTTDEQIAGLLAGLKSVEAPADFHFRVRARIAQGQPRTRRVYWMVPAMPLAFATVLGTYFGWQVMSPTVTPSSPEIVQASESFVSPAPIASAPVITPTVAESRRSSEAALAGLPEPKPQAPVTQVKASPERKAQRQAESGSGGGSEDLAATAVKEIVAPTNTNSPKVASQISGRELLAKNGIVVGAGFVVRSGGSKLQAGDVIEAINGEPVSSTFGNLTTIQTLRVRRDGEIIRIDLK